MDSDVYGQFSVIVRPRCGNPSLLSTYEIVMQIQNKLSKYKGVFNVGVSPPNFVVHLATLEQQLDMLSCKHLAGPDTTLDILPWNEDYISLCIPWITDKSDGVNEGSVQLHQLPDLGTITAMSALKDTANKQITIDNPAQGISSGTYQPHGSIPQQLTDIMPPPDFSYLMILELKDFYYSKLHAFLQCQDSYNHLCTLSRPFFDDLEPRIKTIYEQTKRYSSIPATEVLAAVANFGVSLNYQELFISEEIFGLQLTMESIYRSKKEPICLQMYQMQLPNGQLITPGESGKILKSIFHVVVHALYHTAEIVTNHEECEQYICTKISSPAFQHKYRLSKPATYVQAEAVTYYRFLKYTTNVIGYNVVDANWNTLKDIVCQINHYTHLMSGFQYCVNQISDMISTVQKNVKNMYEELPQQVPSEKIPHIIRNVDSLLSLIQDYNNAARHAVHTFNCHKKRFRSIKLETPYSAKPDET